MIGISFVDILIQAVFLLFVALSIGYIDPVSLLKIKEFEEVGKDLCTKINKDDPRECREIIEPVVERELGKGKLALCLEASASGRSTVSARFVALSPERARFEGFTAPYLEYLASKGDSKRLELARTIPKGSIINISEIELKFGFMREPSCFHSISHRNWEGSWNQRELNEIFRRFTQLQTFAK